jgi:hypothetical protein
MLRALRFSTLTVKEDQITGESHLTSNDYRHFKFNTIVQLNPNAKTIQIQTYQNKSKSTKSSEHINSQLTITIKITNNFKINFINTKKSNRD